MNKLLRAAGGRVPAACVRDEKPYTIFGGANDQPATLEKRAIVARTPWRLIFALAVFLAVHAVLTNPVIAPFWTASISISATMRDVGRVDKISAYDVTDDGMFMRLSPAGREPSLAGRLRIHEALQRGIKLWREISIIVFAPGATFTAPGRLSVEVPFTLTTKKSAKKLKISSAIGLPNLKRSPESSAPVIIGSTVPRR